MLNLFQILILLFCYSQKILKRKIFCLLVLVQNIGPALTTKNLCHS